MNDSKIADELVLMAVNFMPRIRGVFERKENSNERDFNSINFEMQKFISTLRKNEDLDCYIFRCDSRKCMEILIGIEDHEAMKGILKKIEKMFQKMGKKYDIKVGLETFGKGDK